MTDNGSCYRSRAFKKALGERVKSPTHQASPTRPRARSSASTSPMSANGPTPLPTRCCSRSDLRGLAPLLHDHRPTSASEAPSQPTAFNNVTRNYNWVIAPRSSTNCVGVAPIVHVHDDLAALHRRSESQLLRAEPILMIMAVVKHVLTSVPGRLCRPRGLMRLPQLQTSSA